MCAQVFLHSVSVLKLETVRPFDFSANVFFFFYCQGVIMVYYRLSVELIALSIIQNI